MSVSDILNQFLRESKAAKEQGRSPHMITIFESEADEIAARFTTFPRGSSNPQIFGVPVQIIKGEANR